MNNKNKILVGCLALLLVLSVGYALFSETITINGTATAKGSFDLAFSCEHGPWGDSNVEASSSCTVEGQTIITTSTLPKPSESVSFIITIKNNGTIPAVLKTVDSSNNRTDGLADLYDEYYQDSVYKLTGVYTLAHLNGDNTYTSDKAAEDAELTLQPNEEMVIWIWHEWDSSFTGEGVTMPKDGVTMTYNVTLGFEQATAN